MSLTSCSNSSQSTEGDEVTSASNEEDVTSVINEDDYTRFPENSLDAYKIACFAANNDEWIIAAQKWSEGDALGEQEGKLPGWGVAQAFQARLQNGQDAEWNGERAEDAIISACSPLINKYKLG